MRTKFRTIIPILIAVITAISVIPAYAEVIPRESLPENTPQAAANRLSYGVLPQSISSDRYPDGRRWNFTDSIYEFLHKRRGKRVKHEFHISAVFDQYWILRCLRRSSTQDESPNNRYSF